MNEELNKEMKEGQDEELKEFNLNHLQNNNVNFDIHDGPIGVNLYHYDENGKVTDIIYCLGFGNRKGDLRRYLSAVLLGKTDPHEAIESNEQRMGDLLPKVQKKYGDHDALRNPYPVITCRNGVCRFTKEYTSTSLTRALDISVDELWEAIENGIVDYWAAIEYADNYDGDPSW